MTFMKVNKKKLVKVKAGWSPFTIYKVEWYIPGRGVEEIYVKATTGDIAKTKVKRITRLPKTQLSARVLIRKGHWITSGIVVVK